MKTITKFYSGEQDGYLYPREQSIGGVSGDSDACKIFFKLPTQYLSSEWIKRIVFDKQFYDPITKEYHTFEYPLLGDNSFVIPTEITDQCKGKTVNYHLVLTKDDDIIQSHAATLYFSKSAKNTNIITYLSTHAFVDADFTIDTAATVDRPIIRLYRMEGSPEVNLTLEVPYLLNGKIPSKFISGGGGSVNVWEITHESQLIGLTDAKLGDWARGIDGAEGKNFVLMKEPYSVEANWEQITSPTATFTEIQTQDLKVTNTFELGAIADVEKAINSKLELPGNAPGTTEPLRLTYYYEQEVQADKVEVKAHTIKLDNNPKVDEIFTMDVAQADIANNKAGLYSKPLADVKLDVSAKATDAEIESLWS